MQNEYAIEIQNLTKTFGDVVANDHIHLSVKQGEILALLGENGSGKTTLMNMLSGIYKPDSGSIFVNGEQVSINSPEDSKRLGIGMIHQHYKLVENFSAADNIWIGTEKNGLLLKGDRYKKIKEICENFGFDIDPHKMVYDMSVSEKQTVEIIKMLCYGAKILILDEPTAVLTVQEIERLFDVLRKMKAAGHSIVIITHKLNEVMEISDRVTILRKGTYVDTINTEKTNEHQLTELMVGHSVDLKINRKPVEKSEPILEIRELSVLSDEGSKAIDDVSFYIRRGEILGVAGIAGCGQRELCEAIAGLRKIHSGKIVHNGNNVVGMKPKQIIEQGISMSFIPEDRLGMGLAPSLSITDNMMLKTYGNSGRFNPFVDRKTARKRAVALIDDIGISTPSSETPVRRLSGGNVQKVLVGREIQSDPNVIITAYPVRGLDIHSSYAIYDILNEQKKNGVGILFVGEDLDVMLGLCDKIMVLCHGKMAGVVHAHKTTKEELGLMMTGSLDLSVKDGRHMGIASDTKIDESKISDGGDGNGIG